MTKTEKLRNALEKRLDYPCEVWYSRSHPQGWFFKINELPEQRLGFNYESSLLFIERSREFSWIKQILHDNLHALSCIERSEYPEKYQYAKIFCCVKTLSVAMMARISLFVACILTDKIIALTSKIKLE